MRDLIPPKARLTVYTTYTALVIALGAIAVGYASAGATLPTWHTIATDVLVYLGGALGIVAAANVPKDGWREP